MGCASFDMKLTKIKIISASYHPHVKYQSLHMHRESSHSFHVLNPASCGLELTNRSLQKMFAALA
jgi:hypothetical protein